MGEEWIPTGPCVADGDNENCGPGQQLLTRDCTNGTFDFCTEEDTLMKTACELPECPSTIIPPSTGNRD